MKRKKLSEKNQIRLLFIFGVAMILLIAILLVAVIQYVFVEVKLFSEFRL